MKAQALLRLLQRELGYTVTRQTGSHRRLSAPGRPDITFAFHDGKTVPPRIVGVILVQQIGLPRDEAKELIKRV